MQLTIKDLALKSCVQLDVICGIEQHEDPDIDFLSFLRIVDALETSAMEIFAIAESGGDVLKVVKNTPIVAADASGEAIKT